MFKVMILYGGDPNADFKPVIKAVETYCLQACRHTEKTEVSFIPSDHDIDQAHWDDNLFQCL